ncbi:MAG: hypothetical protein EXS13_02565 [Planctomycetes bacterium]|nr:hypothetical protein [Planctomycetota bacterium]
MQRSPLLLLGVLVLALLARAWVRPVYVGAPDPAATTAAFGIAHPFGDDLKGASDALHSLLPRSLLREGLGATGGWPLLNPTDVGPAEFFYYDHHPPGISLLTALAFQLFGTSELTARSVALLFSTVTLLIVAMVARRAGGNIVAALAVLAVAAPPGGLYWATHLDYPVPTMAACALFLALAARDDLDKLGRFGLCAALTSALCFDSLAVLAPAALFIDRLCFGPRGARRLLGWPCVGAAITGILALWKLFQLERYGHGDVGLVANIARTWMLPDGVTSGAWWRAVEGHLRDLVTPLGEGVLAWGVLRSLLPGGDASLKRFVRTSALLAAGAGLLPRLRAWDHPYFQLYWLLPLGGCAALLFAALLNRAVVPPPPADLRVKATAGRSPSLAARKLFAAMVAVAFVILGVRELPRSTIDPTRPSAHRLGLELAAQVPAEAKVVFVPESVRLNIITLCWYGGRMVAPVPGDPPDPAALAPALAPYGLAGLPAWWAKGDPWPGRDGVRRLE